MNNNNKFLLQKQILRLSLNKIKIKNNILKKKKKFIIIIKILFIMKIKFMFQAISLNKAKNTMKVC